MTRFIGVAEHVEKLGIEPCCCIYITDMEATFPEREPEYPVLWISTKGIKEAPFGEVILLNN